MDFIQLKDSEFEKFRKLLFELTGISMSNEKKALVSGRLLKRLRFYQLPSYGKYFDLINDGNEAEMQVMVNLLSTNETYFFRESDHFNFLKEHIQKNFSPQDNFRVWSAASSSGEEAYTVSFILSEYFNDGSWEIVGSDINEEMLAIAQGGVYPIERSKNIPMEYLKKYCLKGVRSQADKFVIKKNVKENIKFHKLNLLSSNLSIGNFDIVFLRNVMIYFNLDTRKQVIKNISNLLKKDGLLIVGHAESLIGVTQEMKALKPTIYHRSN